MRWLSSDDMWIVTVDRLDAFDSGTARSSAAVVQENCGSGITRQHEPAPWSLSLQFPGACQSSGRARLWQPWPKIVLYFIVQHDKMGGGSDEGGHQLWILKRKGGTQRSQRFSSQLFLGEGSLRCLSSYPCTLKSRENTALGFSDQKADRSSDFFLFRTTD